jgi:hypothetical protein
MPWWGAGGRVKAAHLMATTWNRVKTSIADSVAHRSGTWEAQGAL